MPDVLTNEIGEPRLFFHGSYKKIPIFKSLRWQGVGGIYFTPNREDGEDFARCGCMEDGDEPTVMVAHLAITNPFRMYGIDSQVITTERIAELRVLGHDGVIGMTDDGKLETEFVAFDPEQVHMVAMEVIELEPAASPSPSV